MQTIAELLAQELESLSCPCAERHRPAGSGQHHSLHRPLPEGASRQPWTTPPCGRWRSGFSYLRNLEQRREEVKSAIEEQGKLTAELAAAIDSARTLAEVEDLYRPYKQKRRTRATVAREKGLAPLAELLLAQRRDCPDPMQAAQGYHRPGEGGGDGRRRPAGRQRHRGGAAVSDDAASRKTLRELLRTSGATAEPGRQRRRTPSTDCTMTLRSPSPKLAGPSDPGHQPG